MRLLRLICHLSFVICHGAELQARLQPRPSSFPGQLGKEEPDYRRDKHIRKKVRVDIET